MLPRVSGYVLAGGESRRMGTDKALVTLAGEALLELALRKVRAVCGDAAILGGPAERCALFAGYGRVVSDSVAGAGPLGGLLAALQDACAEWVLVVPVDLPLLAGAALRALVEELGQHDGPGVLLYEDDEREQPLPVLIHTSAAGAIAEALQNGERKLLPVLRRCAAESGGPCLLKPRGVRNCDWFTNVNSPEDLAAAEEMLRSGARTDV